jgi:ABC-type antimicrobial peptide transport system permease subunit
MTLGYSPCLGELVPGPHTRAEATLKEFVPRKWGTAGLFHYQLGVEGVEEEVPSDGVAGGVSGAGVVTGAASAAGGGAGAGFGLTARFLAAFLAFFFVAFLAFPFFFAKTRFTGIMFQLWKPNKACLGVGLICRCFCSIHVCTRWPVDRATECSNWLPKTMSCPPHWPDSRGV